MRDAALAASMQAQRAGHFDEAKKIVWDARLATEQSAPDSPQMALYLRRTAGENGTNAETDLRRAMDIDTSAFGPNTCAVAGDLYALAFLYQTTNPVESERILKQALDMLDDRPEKLGMKSTFWAQLASLYVRQNRIAEATAAYEQATRDCDLSKYIPGPCDISRRELAVLYRKQGRTADADRLRSFNPDERDNWQLEQINRHASDAFKNGQYPEAEQTYLRAIQFVQQHPERIYALMGMEHNLLGRVLEKEGRDDEAEQAYLRGLQLMENAAGPKPPQSHYAESLPFVPLIDLYRRTNRLDQSEAIVLHALEIQQKYLSPDNRAIQRTLTTLAGVYQSEKKYPDARSLYERVLPAEEKNLGRDSPQLLHTLNGYANLLREMHDDAALAGVQARINMLQLMQRAAQQKPN